MNIGDRVVTNYLGGWIFDSAGSRYERLKIPGLIIGVDMPDSQMKRMIVKCDFVPDNYSDNFKNRNSEIGLCFFSNELEAS